MGFIKQNFLGGAEEDAARTQAAAADEAEGVTREFGASAVGRLDPFSAVGRNVIAGERGPAGGIIDIIQSGANPNFERSEGFEAINKAAAAGGKGLTSGQRGRDLVDFNSGLETRNFNNRVNSLLSLIQGGQNAATNQGSFDLRTGADISNIKTGKGDALAAGIIGKKNAIGSTITDLATSAGTSGSFLNTGLKKAGGAIKGLF